MNTRFPSLVSLTAAVAGALVLAACGKTDDGATAGQKVDRAVAQVEQKTEAAAQDLKDAAGEAGAKVAAAARDAAITAEINAELAKDGRLSATKIDVDTAQGKVALRGTAPDGESRDRATRIAAAVQGVKSVENFLTLDAKS